MNSLILRSATSLLLPVLLLFSVFLLLRGHDQPGGGFIGGLVGAAAIALYALAYGAPSAARLLPVPARALLGLGLIAAVGAGLAAGFASRDFLTGLWWIFELGTFEVKLSTVLLFDVGVYLVVVGTILTMLFSLEER